MIMALRVIKFPSECCEYASLPETRSLLWECTNKTASVLAASSIRDERKLNIAIVTYSTPSIMSYATYSLAILTAWAEYHSYIIIHTSPASGHAYDTNDPRWNKVKIVRDLLLKRESGKAGRRLYDYVAFIDSDVVVLNFQFALEAVIADHRWVDLIFSRDSQPLNGIMNSGFFLAKNTEWTVAFLERWWGSASSREMAIDQHAFNARWQVTSIVSVSAIFC